MAFNVRISRLIVILFVFFSQMAFGQMDTTEQKFVTHVVEAKETLFGICKEYAIDQETLVKYNPQLTDGLKIGQSLLILVVERQPFENLYLSNEAFLLHRVFPKQTIYSITKEYNVSTQELYDANPELVENGLQIGMLLRIPVKVDLNAPADSAFQKMKPGPSMQPLLRPEVPDSLEGNRYKMGVILPFYLQINDSIDLNRALEEDPTVYRKSKIALDFYFGLRLAIDTLVKSGLNIELSVEDSENDPLIAWTEYMKMRDFDLVVGPLYSDNVLAIANRRGDQGPLLISPFSKKAEIVYSNKNTVQVLPSDRQMLDVLAQTVINRFHSDHLFMVYTDTMQDTINAAYMREKFSHYLDSGKVKEVEVFDAQIDGVDWLKDYDTNVVIVPSTDHVFMTDLITKLNAERLENVVVIGLPDIDRLDVDFSYLNNLHLHYPAAQAVRTNDSLMQSFVIQYRARYFDEPSRFAMQGFDIGYYFGRLLMETGSVEGLTARKEVLLQNGFDFRETQNGSYINKHVFLMKFEDFTRVVVPQD